MTMKLARLLNLFRSGWHLGLMLLIPAVLVACGGTGAGANGGSAVTAGAGAAGAQTTQVQLTSDKLVLNSNKSTPVQFTAVIVDGNGAAIPSRNLTWQVTDTLTPSGVRLEGVVTKTDATGKATASLILSGDQSNRTVKVSAITPDNQASIDIAIAGTSISISGPQTVPFGGVASRFTINLKDSAGLGISSKTLTVSSRSGNSIAQGASVTTDQSGKAVIDVIGAVTGADQLSVSGLGTVAAFDIAVSNESLQVIPAALDIAIGTPSTVQVVYTKNGGIAPGTSVSLVTTRGTVTPSGLVDISSGTASFTISSSTAGPITLAATVGTTQGVANARFIAVTPASIDLQATPAIVGPNQVGQTAERSTLIAIVRDVSNNPVRGKLVAFTNPTDPSGGSVDPPTSITDDSGRATSTFIAGPTPTAPNGVVLKALVIGTALESTANVSVSRSELFVRIGRGDKIEVDDIRAVYKYQYAVIVSDSTGNPVKNANVQIRLTPTRYREGVMFIFSFPGTGSVVTSRYAIDSPKTRADTGTGPYVPDPQYPTFKDWTPSEDLNKDGICQAGEDLSLDGILTPGNFATASSNVLTGDDGAAGVVITYPKQAALWNQVLIEATVKVGGTEGTASAEFELLALASDLTIIDKLPAFQVSPSRSGRLVPRPTCP
jgi:hypothetical protein